MATEQTKQCPKCGYEYEAWVDICPDCGTTLEERPKLELIKGKLDRDTDPRWTVVTNVPNAIIGNFVKGQLEDAGIPVLMFRARSADIAEFSHNDFVPQDLLVPFDRFRDARRLIDSAPGNDYGPRLWDVTTEEEEEEGVEGETALDGAAASPAGDNFPEGWTMLPTEADVRSLQQVRRTRGEALRGWYWSDDGQASTERQPDNDYDEEYDLYEQDYEPERDDLFQRRAASPYGTRGYAEDWTRPSKWIKLIYAILLFIMSLPFILQLLQQIWSMMGRIP